MTHEQIKASAPDGATHYSDSIFGVAYYKFQDGELLSWLPILRIFKYTGSADGDLIPL